LARSESADSAAAPIDETLRVAQDEAAEVRADAGIEEERIEVDRRRLRDEIAATRLRIEKASGAVPRAAVERELGGTVLAALDELSAIEDEQLANIDSVRAEARDEAARILEDAREHAVAIHSRATKLDDSIAHSVERVGPEE
jgi:hypothetical protein